MIYHFEPIDILFFIAAIVSLLIAITAWVRRVKPGGKAFACAMFSVFLWLIFRVFEGVADTYSGKIFWAKCRCFISSSPANTVVMIPG
jgi:hypothetical protein